MCFHLAPSGAPQVDFADQRLAVRVLSFVHMVFDLLPEAVVVPDQDFPQPFVVDPRVVDQGMRGRRLQDVSQGLVADFESFLFILDRDTTI